MNFLKMNIKGDEHCLRQDCAHKACIRATSDYRSMRIRKSFQAYSTRVKADFVEFQEDFHLNDLYDYFYRYLSEFDFIDLMDDSTYIVSVFKSIPYSMCKNFKNHLKRCAASTGNAESVYYLLGEITVIDFSIANDKTCKNLRKKNKEQILDMLDRDTVDFQANSDIVDDQIGHFSDVVDFGVGCDTVDFQMFSSASASLHNIQEASSSVKKVAEQVEEFFECIDIPKLIDATMFNEDLIVRGVKQSCESITMTSDVIRDSALAVGESTDRLIEKSTQVVGDLSQQFDMRLEQIVNELTIKSDHFDENTKMFYTNMQIEATRLANEGKTFLENSSQITADLSEKVEHKLEDFSQLLELFGTSVMADSAKVSDKLCSFLDVITPQVKETLEYQSFFLRVVDNAKKHIDGIVATLVSMVSNTDTINVIAGITSISSMLGLSREIVSKIISHFTTHNK